MRLLSTLVLTTILATSTVAASMPSPLMHLARSSRDTAVDSQSVSGKVSSIGDASFTIDVMNEKELTTIQFTVDGNTRVEGKLTVGAQASVEYRSDAGQNMAVRVIVTSASGMNR